MGFFYSFVLVASLKISGNSSLLPPVSLLYSLPESLTISNYVVVSIPNSKKFSSPIEHDAAPKLPLEAAFQFRLAHTNRTFLLLGIIRIGLPGAARFPDRV